MLSNAPLALGHRAMRPKMECTLDLSIDVMHAGGGTIVVDGQTVNLNHAEEVSRPAVS